MATTAISQEDSLRIITWNIHCLPTICEQDGQIKRAPYIGQAIKGSDADVVCIQEMFRKKVYSIVEKEVLGSFPYTTGLAKRRHLLKLNSGLTVFSKYPIEIIKIISFKKSRSCDRFSDKGAILFRILKDGKWIYIINTHLQSDLDTGPDFQYIRRAQYGQIKRELLDCYKNIQPIILAGDFNTSKELAGDYAQMLYCLGGVADCELKDSACFTFDYRNNEFNARLPLQSATIDYILYTPNKKRDIIPHKTKMLKFQAPWSEKNEDLSDHYAVETVVYF